VGTGPGLYIILSVTFFGAATSQAAIQEVHVKHHHVPVVKTLRIDAAPRRVCDWIGPGGRAIYRCVLVNQAPLVVTQNNAAPPRSCDWIGPGGRAVYRCR
jgi:hypothetical protein